MSGGCGLGTGPEFVGGFAQARREGLGIFRASWGGESCPDGLELVDHFLVFTSAPPAGGRIVIFLQLAQFAVEMTDDGGDGAKFGGVLDELAEGIGLDEPLGEGGGEGLNRRVSRARVCSARHSR